MFSISLLCVDDVRLDRYQCFDYHIFDLVFGTLIIEAHLGELSFKLKQVPFAAIWSGSAIFFFYHGAVVDFIVILDVALDVSFVNGVVCEMNESLFEACEVCRVLFCCKSCQSLFEEIDF